MPAKPKVHREPNIEISERRRVLNQFKRIINNIQNSGFEEYYQKDIQELKDVLGRIDTTSLQELKEIEIKYNRLLSAIGQRQAEQERAQVTSDLLKDYGRESDRRLQDIMNGQDAQTIHSSTLQALDDILDDDSVPTPRM